MTLAEFLVCPDAVVRICVAEARGSAPREVGAGMFISHTYEYGTIGGGQLEYMAVDEARKLLVSGANRGQMDVPLGPEIGQCCGGRVRLELVRLDAAGRQAALVAEKRADLPRVFVFGAGHVGRALVRALAPLPLRTALVDSRAEELAKAHCLDKRLTALPESEIRQAAPGTAFVIATHDHALDFLLAGAAMERGDAAYVGMIGSATKRARFTAWARRNMPRIEPLALTCPIGKAGLGDKRPEVIAAFTAAELLSVFASQSIPDCMERSA